MKKRNETPFKSLVIVKEGKHTRSFVAMRTIAPKMMEELYNIESDDFFELVYDMWSENLEPREVRELQFHLDMLKTQRRARGVTIIRGVTLMAGGSLPARKPKGKKK